MKICKFKKDPGAPFEKKAHGDGVHVCGGTTISTNFGQGFVCCTLIWKKVTCEDCLKKRNSK